jgi:hypothetical protein
MAHSLVQEAKRADRLETLAPTPQAASPGEPVPLPLEALPPVEISDRRVEGSVGTIGEGSLRRLARVGASGGAGAEAHRHGWGYEHASGDRLPIERLRPSSDRRHAPASSPVVRRTILDGSTEGPEVLDVTWLRFTKDYSGEADTLRKEVASEWSRRDYPRFATAEDLEKRISAGWSKLRSNKKLTYDVRGADFVGQLVGRMNSSNEAARRKRKRDEMSADLVPEQDAGETPFKHSPGLRGGEWEPVNPVEFTYQKLSDAQLFQRHVSTVLLKRHGGTEVQASLAKDQKSMVVSSNENKVNKVIRDQYDTFGQIRDAALEQVGLNLKDLEEDGANKDRLLRHPMHLLLNIGSRFASEGVVQVPGPVNPKLNGRHAEIRIFESGLFNELTHHTMTGTKYPCAGCRSYFLGKHALVNRSTKWFLTAGGLNSQIEKALLGGHDSIAKLTNGEVASGRAAIKKGHKSMLEHGVEFATSKLRGNRFSMETDPDSDDETDVKGAEFEKIQEMVRKFAEENAECLGATRDVSSEPAQKKRKLDQPDPV